MVWYCVRVAEGDLSRTDVKTRKNLTSNGCLHPGVTMEKLHLKRTTGARGLVSVKDFVLSECNGLWKYVDTSNEPMLQDSKSEDFLIETMGEKEYEKNSEDQKQGKWKSKNVHEKLACSTFDISDSLCHCCGKHQNL